MLLQVVLLFILKHSSDIYVQSFVICPYCDPNHMAYPNMEEAVRGYDVPMGNPNPGRGESDPGIRNQIFNPMVRNSDGYYKLDGSWISANTQIKCDATWSSEIYDTFKGYKDGKTKSISTGYGIEFGPSINADINTPEIFKAYLGGIGVKVSDITSVLNASGIATLLKLPGIASVLNVSDNNNTKVGKRLYNAFQKLNVPGVESLLNVSINDYKKVGERLFDVAQIIGHVYMTGGIGLGSMDINGGVGGAGRSAIKIPPLFTRSWSNSQDIDRVKDFFVKEKGSVAITDAVCLTHKIDISDLSKKQFVEPFIDSVRSIYSVIKSGNKNAQIREFKRFVNEFGTHYSSSAEMGTRISIERRYTAAERSGAEDNELKDCNTVAGAALLGLQLELDNFKCKNEQLIEDSIESKSVERTVISTYGSFIAESLAEWSKQVISLVQASSFSPRAIRRELKSHLNLFQPHNFGELLDENGEKINVTVIREWMTPLYANYCSIFELDCNETGCGFDDDCLPEQWCVNTKQNRTGFKCVHKKVSIENLPSGYSYAGEVDVGLKPSGHGTKFRPNGHIEYIGEFHNGFKQGKGTVFYENGNKAYKGDFSKGLMTGRGVMYYLSGQPLARGIFKNGILEKGQVLGMKGEVLETKNAGKKEKQVKQVTKSK